MSLTAATAQSILESDFAPWVKALQLDILGIGPDGATLSMPVTPHVLRIGDILSGQALSALADTGMVFACAGALGTWRPVATTNLEVQFLRPGSGTSIHCDARVTRRGTALIFARAEMTARPSDKLVATATANFYLP